MNPPQIELHHGLPGVAVTCAPARVAQGTAVAPRFAVPLLVVLTLAAWGAVPWGTFNFDDYQNVVLDGATAGQTALSARLLAGVRPLLRLSYVFDYHMWGMTAAGFLATNLALHVAMVLGVYVLARRRQAAIFVKRKIPDDSSSMRVTGQRYPDPAGA